MSDIKETEERLDKIRRFTSGARRDSNYGKPNVHDMQGYTLLRFGYHMELGEQNYGEGNYLKGIPDEVAKESLARHYANVMSGDDKEDNLSAIIFGCQLLMLNQEKRGIAPDHYYNKIKGDSTKKEEEVQD